MEIIMSSQFPIKALAILSLMIILSACKMPQAAAPTPFGNAVATQVAVLLTSNPAATNPQPAAETPIVTNLSPATQTKAAPSPATSTPLPPTAKPTQAPTKTPKPKPTATQVEGDPRLTLGDPTFQDKKFKEDNNWGSAWQDKFTKGEFIDNQLVLTSVGVDGWTLTWPKFANFYIEMTAATGDCSGMDRYGLIVRVPESYDRGYLFGFTCDGRYSLRIWDPTGKKYIDVIKWVHSDEINAGSNQTNRMGLMVDGNKLTLYANGHLLSSATNSRFDKGYFGPFIGHTETTNFTISIKEIAAWELP
jgi:hypothetical protein